MFFLTIYQLQRDLLNGFLQNLKNSLRSSLVFLKWPLKAITVNFEDAEPLRRRGIAMLTFNKYVRAGWWALYIGL